MVLNDQIESHEQNHLQKTLIRLLKDLTRPNAVRIKAGLQILMTTDLHNFETIISKPIQKELNDFKTLLEHPDTIASLSCRTASGKIAILHTIKSFVLNNLFLLDDRTAILPDVNTVTKSVMGGERLKSVVHTSALRNVTTSASFVEVLEKQLKSKGYAGESLEQLIKEATNSMARLYTAIIEGNIYQVKKELETKGLDINIPNPDGLSPLHLATRGGHTHIVELLVAVPGIRINSVNNNGWTALHFAARFGFIEIAKLLIRAPEIQINLVNSDGWTPLHWAAWHGHAGVIAALMSCADLNINPLDSSLCMPLHWAARNGQADVIALLLSTSSIEVNGLDIDSKTPLHYAICYDHISAASSLLSSPLLNINIQDIDGLTPLHWAARNGQLDMVTLLLSVSNIRKDMLDHNYMTPRDWAKRNGYYELLPRLSTNHTVNLHSYITQIWQSLKSLFTRKIEF